MTAGKERAAMTTLAPELTAAAEAAAPAQAEQLDLLDFVPTRFEPHTPKHTEMVESIKRGRPAGARNLATRDVVNFVRKVFGCPMIESGRWLMHTPTSLAAELQCTPLEAFDRLEKIRSDLRLFMFARLAPIDGQGNTVTPIFNMQIAAGNTSVAAGKPPWEYMTYDDDKAGAADEPKPPGELPPKGDRDRKN